MPPLAAEGADALAGVGVGRCFAPFEFTPREQVAAILLLSPSRRRSGRVPKWSKTRREMARARCGANGVGKGFATNRLVSVRMEPRETLPDHYVGIHPHFVVSLLLGIPLITYRDGI